MLFKTLRPLRPLLLAGICLCVYGSPIHLPGVQHSRGCSRECVGYPKTKNLRSDPSGASGLPWKVGAGGGAAPHEPPAGAAPVTQRENGDGRSGSSVAGGGVWNNRSGMKKVGTASETGDSQRQSSSVSTLSPDPLATPQQAEELTARFPLPGTLAPSSILPQVNITKRESRDQEDANDNEHQRDRTHHRPSSIPPLDFITPQTSTPIWDHRGPTVSSQPDLGPNVLPKEDGPGSVWTEATRAGEAVTVVALSPPIADWPSPWQTSGGEQLESATLPSTSVSPQPAGGAAKMPKLEAISPTRGPAFSSDQHAMTASTATARHHKSRSGLEAMESDEGSDEDEEDESSEESLEDESEEDVTETPESSSVWPLVCMFPLPPVYVQRNQGLMQSWLELIREKVGNVYGMLAPFGICISVALLIVGVVYGIRTIHRKRRNHLKRQRETRQQRPENCSSSQEQAMLLADSSALTLWTYFFVNDQSDNGD